MSSLEGFKEVPDSSINSDIVEAIEESATCFWNELQHSEQKVILDDLSLYLPTKDLLGLHIADKKTKSSSKELAMLPINIRKKQVASKQYLTSYARRGIAIIVNQLGYEQQLNLSYRHGSNIDVKALESLFEYLKFDIKKIVDKKFEQIMQELKLQEWRKFFALSGVFWNDVAESDLKKYGMLIVIAMSHGGKGTIYARDKRYNENILLEPFLSKNCCDMIAKPKIVLYQKCNGGKEDTGVVMTTEPQSLSDDDDVIIEPQMTDIVKGYSSYDGFVSWLGVYEGSAYIQELVKVIKKEASKEDFLSILTLTAQKVALRNDVDDKGIPIKQMPFFTSSLLHKLYLKN